MLARVENGRAKTLAENSPVNIAALVDFIEYTLDDIKGSISIAFEDDAVVLHCSFRFAEEDERHELDVIIGAVSVEVVSE